MKYKIVKLKEANEQMCTACIALTAGIIASWLKQYPIMVSQTLHIPPSMYVWTYMFLYMTSLFVYISPLLFLQNKWKPIVINTSIVILFVITTRHYFNVMNSPQLYLDLYNDIFNFKALYV